MCNLDKIKSGDILLVHSMKPISKAIQFFQEIEDKNAGYYNHSGIFLWIGEELYIAEADYLHRGEKKAKIKAAVVITPFKEYLDRLSDKEVELRHLALINNNINYNKLTKVIMRLEGTIYDYENLFLQIPRILLKRVYKLLGKEYKPKEIRNPDKGYICHEFTQRVYNLMFGWFNNWDTNNVTPIYNDKHFTHNII